MHAIKGGLHGDSDNSRLAGLHDAGNNVSYSHDNSDGTHAHTVCYCMYSRAAAATMDKAGGQTSAVLLHHNTAFDVICCTK